MTVLTASGRATTFSPQTAGLPLATIVAAATHKPVILEIGVSFVASLAVILGAGRPAVNGTLPKRVFPFSDQQNGDGREGLATLVTEWDNPPTAPTQYVRRSSPGVVIGGGVLWTFARGLSLPVSGQLCIWHILANSNTQQGYDFWVTIDE